MIRIKEVMLIAFVVILTTNVQAQTDSVYSFTLTEAQNYAIGHYYMSKNAELDIKIAKKKIWETTAIGLPQISAEVAYQYIPGEIPEFSMGGGDGNDPFSLLFQGAIDNGWFGPEDLETGGGSPIAEKTSLTYSVILSQLIFSGEYIVGLQASKTYSTFSNENFEKTKIDLRQNVASTYYSIILINKNIEVLTKTLENIKMNYDHTKKFFEQGLVEDTDVDQLKLVMKRTENSLSQIQRQKDYLLKLFKYQLGMDAKATIELSQSLEDLVSNNVVSEQNYVFNLNDNIDFKLLSTQEKLQNLSMKREMSTFLPTVSGFYQYSDKTNKAALDFTINHIIGLNVKIPIFSSGMKLSKVSQAKMEYIKAQNMREQESQRLVLTAEQSKYDYNIALQKYYNELENFELSERIFSKTTVRFKEGLVSALDLSMVNNQYLEAQLSLSKATQELLMTKIELDKLHNKL